MTDRTPHRGSSRLRRIAALLVHGPDARSILDDMDELFTRDVDRGMSRRRAALRASALVDAERERRNGFARSISRHEHSWPVVNATWID